MNTIGIEVNVDDIVEQITTTDLVAELKKRNDVQAEKIELIRDILGLNHLSTYEDICEALKTIM